MLPNLKFMVCGILFCVFMFAAAGTGVMLPDSRTRIGEMPAIGRSMMQQSIAEAPAQAHIYMTAIAPRSEEPPRDRSKPDVVANVPAADQPVANPPAAGLPPDARQQADAAALAQGPSAALAPRPGDDRAGNAAPLDIAADTPPAAEDGAAVAPFVNVPLPPPRPAVFGGPRQHGHLFHYKQPLLERSGAATGAYPDP